MKGISIGQNDRRCLISFDFDDTIAETIVGAGAYGADVLVSIPKFIELMVEYSVLGCCCIILTARTPKHLSEIESFLKWHDIREYVDEIHFTSHELKGPIAKELGVNLHYDDSLKHLNSVREHGIQVVCSVPEANP